MRYRKVQDPKELREQERAQALAVKNQANIDYMALMLDVDLEDEAEVIEDVESV